MRQVCAVAKKKTNPIYSIEAPYAAMAAFADTVDQDQTAQKGDEVSSWICTVWKV